MRNKTTDLMRQTPRGMSLIGFLFVTAVVLIVALMAFRTIPAYIEWYTIQKALTEAMADANDPTLNNIRKVMDRKLSADYADAVSPKDIEIRREGNTIIAYVAWEKRLPLVYNASLLLEFEATASR